MNKSDSIANLALALCKAQASMDKAKKSSANPFFKSKYADLSSVWEACGASLSENDLSIAQMPCEAPEGYAGLETVLMHKSGEWISNVMWTPLTKKDPQGFCSALTYARRYGLSSMVGVCTMDQDDDGEAAMGRNDKKRTEGKVPDSMKKFDAEKIDDVEIRVKERISESALETVFLDACEQISKSNSLKELKDAFADAFKFMKENEQEGYVNKLISMKDVRKEELENV